MPDIDDLIFGADSDETRKRTLNRPGYCRACPFI